MYTLREGMDSLNIQFEDITNIIDKNIVNNKFTAESVNNKLLSLNNDKIREYIKNRLKDVNYLL